MLTHIRPLRTRFANKTRPRFKDPVTSVQSLRPVQDRQVPRAPLPAAGVTVQRGDVEHLLERRYPFVLAPTGSCASPGVSPRLRSSLGQGVYAGCRQSLLTPGPSRRYLQHPCGGAWTPTPPCPPGACPFLPRRPWPRPSVYELGTQNYPCNATSTGTSISGLQSFTNVQAPSLARPPDCTHRDDSKFVGRPGRIPHAGLTELPPMSNGIATCPITSNWHGGTYTRWTLALSAVTRTP